MFPDVISAAIWKITEKRKLFTVTLAKKITPTKFDK